MAKLAPRPKADTGSATDSKKSNKDIDRLADDFINKGGKSIIHNGASRTGRGRRSEQTNPDAEIGVTVKLLVKERDQIERIREARPKKRNKIMSLQEWIEEAIEDKRKRELTKYNIQY